ncbi:MAG: MarR family transcriptional regulator [Firmicutes bacterium]|nr:MarR family transcriptional regulator [Bacillota bacterium]
MKDFKERLNYFFVKCFYSILLSEEKSLAQITGGDLSLKEVHVIEQVFRTMENSKNTFSVIAEKLNVTLGTLTTAFNKLEKKGYLVKVQDTNDRRIFYVKPTKKAEEINNKHLDFHKRMIDDVIKLMPNTDVEQLITSLEGLAEFFKTFK